MQFRDFCCEIVNNISAVRRFSLAFGLMTMTNDHLRYGREIAYEDKLYAYLHIVYETLL
jgi:hypothetical protein